MVMICYDTWLCKSNPSVVVSLFLGTGTFKYCSVAFITEITERGSLLLYLIDIFDARVMKVGSLLSMLRLMLGLMLRLVSMLRRAGMVLGVILVMLDWLLCVSIQQLTTNLLR